MKRAWMTWDRKILRKIYGRPCGNGSWRLEMNQEIYNKFISPDIATVVKVRRLEWFEHVVRLNGERAVNRLLKGKPCGGGKMGRPSLRWMDDVDIDVRNMEEEEQQQVWT
jgi:hypothetical protein